MTEILHASDTIPCTACAYCTEVCPKKIPIPSLFACLNTKKTYGGGGFYYGVLTGQGGKASDCIRCGRCESICPQHLPIRDLLTEVAENFEQPKS